MDRYFSCRWARTNWFLLLLPLLLLLELLVAQWNDWSVPSLLEAAIVFDLCIFVPALYVACYHRKVSRRALLIRLTALACMGVFVGSLLVPTEAQMVLPHLAWARTAGIVLVGLIELKMCIELLKLVFAGGTTAEVLAEKSGVPTWAARIMMLEARFWTAVWRFVRR